MAIPETMDAATTRLLLPDHAEVLMRHIEDLQWTETFSDLTIHVSPTLTLTFVRFEMPYLFLVSGWRGEVPSHYGLRHQPDVEKYPVGIGLR